MDDLFLLPTSDVEQASQGKQAKCVCVRGHIPVCER